MIINYYLCSSVFGSKLRIFYTKRWRNILLTRWEKLARTEYHKKYFFACIKIEPSVSIGLLRNMCLHCFCALGFFILFGNVETKLNCMVHGHHLNCYCFIIFHALRTLKKQKSNTIQKTCRRCFENYHLNYFYFTFRGSRAMPVRDI